MIILRQKEFGRTGKSSGQAKMWFEGGNKKQNKDAQRKWKQEGGAKKLAEKEHKFLWSSPADYAVGFNDEIRNGFFKKDIENGTLSESKLRKGKGKIIKDIKDDLAKSKKASTPLAKTPISRIKSQTPKAIIKKQISKIKSGVNSIRETIGSRAKKLIRKI